MEHPNHSNKFKRKRKFLLVLPALIIPFITMAFWALGGGKGTGAQAGQIKSPAGLNLQLPNANLKEDKSMDKMAFYQKAERDSEKIRDFIKNDPNLKKQLEKADANEEDTVLEEPSVVHTKKYTDPNEEKVYKKLDLLNHVLNQTASGSAIKEKDFLKRTEVPEETSQQQKKLKELMEQMNSGASSGDTEMNQLNGMLEKILDIQHPERVKDRFEQKYAKSKEQVYAVSKEVTANNISLLDTNRTKNNNNDDSKFFGINNEQNESDGKQNAIEAVVHETQTLVNGAVIKMRLLNDVYINGHMIHKDNFIYGTAMLNNERLVINIKSMRDEHSIYPVKMEVYDMDGLQGIYIPGAITRDVAKQSTDNAIQSLALNSLDPSIGAQAASAGIETAKQLLSKKVKLVKVQVKAGYRILLKDMN
ncbi:MAG: conjugative transposon protein TraM [Bacteroidota bacterium]